MCAPPRRGIIKKKSRFLTVHVHENIKRSIALFFFESPLLSSNSQIVNQSDKCIIRKITSKILR